ncbi:type III effector protein AvrPto1 [Herbaspirillum sp. 1173]|uniref:hypothetical protein n=1 Tax=unclassified Herbaspirillum TaxID=2624150 RepID=UPI001AE43CCA|nr:MULTISPECIES: hypothetical protein [unclassified Herbaspirillum]MBP1313383.1 type III effector protein AvrPto1 [Herbaspirillum sp. 1130]MDR6738624.1 type III effector protein AvrPto1 [Herbaspirillum sp. 1173]
MGNLCVGGSRDAQEVNSPNHENHVIARQILEKRNELRNAAGVPQNQYDYVLNAAPEELRNRYNSLFTATNNSIRMADVIHDYLAEISRVHPGVITPQSTLTDLNEKIEAWTAMRTSIEAHMRSNGAPYTAVIGPSGSRRIGFQTF